MVVGKNSSNILYSCIRSAAHDIYVHLLLLSFCSFLTVGQTFAAANSYVSVESESGRVVCIGSDFLVIPDDPFLEEAVHVCVAAEVGWILSSSASLDIDSGLNACWEVEGDSDNPEDSASGCIYVAKITLLSNTVDLLRANSTDRLLEITSNY